MYTKCLLWNQRLKLTLQILNEIRVSATPNDVCALRYSITQQTHGIIDKNYTVHATSLFALRRLPA